MKAYLTSVFSLIICTAILGQVGFYNATAKILGEERLNSTICIGFEDLDGDLQDDLFLLDRGIELKTFIQGAPQQAFSFREHEVVSAFGDWSVVSGDLDNDGVPEIICSGVGEGSQVLKFNGQSYTTAASTEGIHAQNSNLVDLNNDGYLDFFVCNDVGESQTYINNGSGGLIKTKLIDFQTTPEDDMSGNYSSIFTDIDGDGDLDLYIGKCKAGVSDPTDPRRINTLYINNGDGTYTERAEDFGLNTGAQTWSVDSGDVDNDGDTDILIGNHAQAHDLMINDGNGHFERRTLIPGGYISLNIQSFFCDFDNNGWLDIFFTDFEDSFILFNDEMSFTRREVAPSGRKAFSGATGDLNSDGFPDLYLTYASSFQNPSSAADRILLNETNTNNYLDINLVGTISNRDAIGAKVTIHQGNKMQYREVIAGKSYGIMNTTVLHFGLGQSTTIDSIRVLWPSGMKSIIKNITRINTVLSISEDGCMTSTYAMPNLQLCNGDSVRVDLPIEFTNINWSTGADQQTIWIKEPGWYRAQFTMDGCPSQTSYFEVTEKLDLEATDIVSDREIVACAGDVVELKSHPGIAYFWSTGETSEVIEVMESGIYNVSLSTNCDNYISEDVDVFFAESSIPEVENDSVLIGESAVFVGDSEDLNWYQNKNDLEPLTTGIEFVTPEIFEDQTYFVGEVTEGYGFNGAMMKTIPLNNVGDTIYSQNDFVEFEVFDQMVFYSVKARTQRAGIRRFVLFQDTAELTSFDYELASGVNTITFDQQLEPGIYKVGTDSDVNLMNLNTEHPQLSYSELYVENDKRIDGVLSISNSELYPGVTPYFFDWEIYYGYYYCEPRVPVHAVIKMPVSTNDDATNSIIYPNPTKGQLTIRTEMQLPYQIDVLDVSGSKAMNTIIADRSDFTLEMPINPGIYFLKLTNQRSSYSERIIVVN
ncbi:MAG: FG-GAP-like repeat-containing protein [Bacteroidota bacterium]